MNDKTTPKMRIKNPNIYTKSDPQEIIIPKNNEIANRTNIL